jgi:hypothetical protein
MDMYLVDSHGLSDEMSPQFRCKAVDNGQLIRLDWGQR